MAPVVTELKTRPTAFEVVVAVTGQHREMLDQVLHLFNIKPNFDLNIMMPGQSLYDITTQVLLGMRDVLTQSRPDLVLVHGDTTTSMAASLAAFYQQIPVGHVEAGLRTNNLLSPWPEELNRQITGRIAGLHFAPTETAKENLLKENVPAGRIVVTGNTVVDAIIDIHGRLQQQSGNRQSVTAMLKSMGYDAERITAGKRKLVLITGHRRENFGGGFVHICEAIVALAAQFKEVDFVYPVHLNPNVRKPVREIIVTEHNPNVFLIEPLDYMPFVYLMGLAELILTDSGGIQEEAPGLGKPVLVMRETTERPEALNAGTVLLVGTDKEKIIQSVTALLTEPDTYRRMSKAINPYGDGLAAKRIADYLQNVYFDMIKG